MTDRPGERRAARLAAIARQLRDDVDRLSFGGPVTTVYNPLGYAWAPHEAYLRRFGGGPKEVVLMGMNPGPWGMAQTGVPFGDPGLVTGWLGIDGEVGRPPVEHPKRPVLGFASPRAEVSGARLWGWARDRFGTPERFFARFFVQNYCPLVFMEQSGRNRTPDKLPVAERAPLLEACDRALAAALEALDPTMVIGIGGFAEGCLTRVLGGREGAPRIGRILHPSPASPKANRGWAEAAEAELRAQGVPLS
ncbi:MAG: uracil-DNA glycosylase family protein [Sandaracinaceae bacterium]